MKLKTESPICEHCGYDERTQNDPHHLSAGTVLKEQYLIGKVLGQGGFGITYLGWDLYLDIPVAVKEYYPAGVVMRDTSVTMDVVSCSGDDGARFRNNKERFLREAKMLARFSQVPEIVQVKNFFLANNTAYIVMEYVEGITLKQYVKDQGGKLSVDETLSILRPVMEGLCKVHKAGLVHRDISPDNIMMLPGGGVKLLDFGAVRDVGAAAVDKQLTKSTEAILKQGYAPIEQYQKRGGLGPWTDVYALCATIYFCLTGEVPPDAPERLLGYEDLNLQEKVPALSETQAKALEHGMELRAEKRTPSMDELCQELFQEDPLPPPPPPPPPPKPKRRYGLLALAAVLALAAAGLIWLLVGSRNSTQEPAPDPGKNAVQETVAGSTITGACGEHLTWTLEDGTLTIQGHAKMDDFRSQDVFTNEDLPFPPWHDYREQITSVVIGDGISNVGECAFFGYDTIQSVQFGSTVAEIGYHAFWGCGIGELNLPDSLNYIGESAFSFNPLTEVVLPDNLGYVERGAFDGIDQLKTVTIGPNTRLNMDFPWYGPLFGSGQQLTIRCYTNSIAEQYASVCGHHTESVGMNDWEAIGQCGDQLYYYLDTDAGYLKLQGTGDMWDFNGTWMQDEQNKHDWINGRELPPWTDYREDIYTVYIPDGVASIGANAFENCHNLQDVYFGNTVEHIKFQSFLDTAVKRIVLPESATRIDSYAFNWCDDLQYMRLPESLEVLEDDAIAECLSLRELSIGPNTTIEVSDGLPLTNGNEECRHTYPDLTICGLPGSDAERFAKEYGFQFVTGARGMRAEAEGQCGDDVWWFKSGDTLVLYGTGHTWLYRISDQEREEWALRDWPESWLQYGNPEYYIFRNEIRRIVILPGVESIQHCLFCDMDQLQEVDFGTVVQVEMNFSNCGSLTELVLPESVVSIGGWALTRCQNLRRVTIENGSSGFSDGIFEGCVSLEEVWFSGKERIGNEDLFSPNGGEYSDHVTFYVKNGSDALRYAKEHNIPYEIVE